MFLCSFYRRRKIARWKAIVYQWPYHGMALPKFNRATYLSLKLMILYCCRLMWIPKQSTSTTLGKWFSLATSIYYCFHRFYFSAPVSCRFTLTQLNCVMDRRWRMFLLGFMQDICMFCGEVIGYFVKSIYNLRHCQFFACYTSRQFREYTMNRVL